METITYLAALTLALSGAPGKSGTASPLVGTWRSHVSQEVRDIARKMGLPEPQAQFVFKEDNTFSYTSPGKSFGGTYELAEHSVRLSPSAESGWPSLISAELKGNNSELDVDGLKYSRGANLIGTWTLRTSSGEDASTKMVFKEDGTFAFTGHFASSKGKYKLDGDQLTLEWTDIDEDKVEPGTVRKTFVFNGNGWLQIDNYRYAKL